MDKLRALQYLVAAAEASSFSGAARELGVSVAAVAKLVTALEKDLGLRLFERHTQGLALTAGGASYLEAARCSRNWPMPTSRPARGQRRRAAPSWSACSR
jgi:DNA-binding transcriptional LysR family regulator